jgi:pyruvate/2-oxoglutarate dehydrogenase complex dihydrolipoamide dehydrogenase (E3) component
VTLIEAAEHALPAEEPEQGAAMDQVIRDEGMALHTSTVALAVRRADRLVAVNLSDGTTVEGERLLVATGRRLALPGWAWTPSAWTPTPRRWPPTPTCTPAT